MFNRDEEEQQIEKTSQSAQDKLDLFCENAAYSYVRDAMLYAKGLGMDYWESLRILQKHLEIILSAFDKFKKEKGHK